MQRVPWKDNIRDDSGLVLAVLEMRIGEKEKYLFELQDRDSHQLFKLLTPPIPSSIPNDRCNTAARDTAPFSRGMDVPVPLRRN